MKWFFEAILFVLLFLLTTLLVTIITHEIYRINLIEKSIQALELKNTPNLQNKLCK